MFCHPQVVSAIALVILSKTAVVSANSSEKLFVEVKGNDDIAFVPYGHGDDRTANQPVMRAKNLCRKRRMPCRTIQHAVTVANAGDTIRVGVGTFVERVMIPPSKEGLRLVGSTKDASLSRVSAPLAKESTGLGKDGNTAIDDKSASVLDIHAPHVTVKRLSVIHQGPWQENDKSSVGILIRPSAHGSRVGRTAVMLEKQDDKEKSGGNEVEDEQGMMDSTSRRIGKHISSAGISVESSSQPSDVRIKRTSVVGQHDMGVQLTSGSRRTFLRSVVVTSARQHGVFVADAPTMDLTSPSPMNPKTSFQKATDFLAEMFQWKNMSFWRKQDMTLEKKESSDGNPTSLPNKKRPNRIVDCTIVGSGKDGIHVEPQAVSREKVVVVSSRATGNGGYGIHLCDPGASTPCDETTDSLQLGKPKSSPSKNASIKTRPKLRKLHKDNWLEGNFRGGTNVKRH